MTRISVIIPLFNRAEFIDAALRSALTQADGIDLDIIVVDDGSTDDGPAIVGALAARHPVIRMIRTENGGVAAARNVGLRHVSSDCDFIGFLDSDDVLPAGRLTADLAEFDASPEIAFTYGHMMMIDRIDPETLLPAADANKAIIRSIHVGAGLFRKALIDQIGFFDETMTQGEDTDFLLRAFESGAPYRLIETNTLYYRQHTGNMTHDRKVVIQFLIRALRRSIVRRRINPAARIPPHLFNMRALRDIQFEI